MTNFEQITAVIEDLESRIAEKRETIQDISNMIVSQAEYLAQNLEVKINAATGDVFHDNRFDHLGNLSDRIQRASENIVSIRKDLDWHRSGLIALEVSLRQVYKISEPSPAEVDFSDAKINQDYS